MKKQKTLTITGNFTNDLDRLCEAYANRGWYYGKHLAAGLERVARDFRETLKIALEDRKNGLHFWESGGEYVTGFNETEPSDYHRKAAEQ